MSAFSDYLENKLIDLILRGQAFAAPANVYIALHTADPLDNDSGAEVAGAGYAREAVAGALASWAGTQGAGTTVASSGTGGATSNNAVIDFGVVGAGGWGTATHVGFHDAASGGNLLLRGALLIPKTLNEGDPVSFGIGDRDVAFA
jgi:hypothetical protein